MQGQPHRHRWVGTRDRGRQAQCLWVSACRLSHACTSACPFGNRWPICPHALPSSAAAEAVRVAKIHLAYSDRYSGLLVVSPVSSRVSGMGTWIGQPGWSPDFMAADGLVSCRGSLDSHSQILHAASHCRSSMPTRRSASCWATPQVGWLCC